MRRLTRKKLREYNRYKLLKDIAYILMVPFRVLYLVLYWIGKNILFNLDFWKFLLVCIILFAIMWFCGEPV